MSSYLNAYSTAHTKHLPDGRNYRFAGEDVGERRVAIGGGGLGRGRKARPRSTVAKIYTAVARRGGIIPRSSFFPPPPPASAPPLRLGQATQSSHHIDLYILSPLRPLDNTQWRTLHPPESGTPGSFYVDVSPHADNPAHPLFLRYLGPVPHDVSYYSKCMLGGALACGITHAGITPLDVTKCNMQVRK